MVKVEVEVMVKVERVEVEEKVEVKVEVERVNGEIWRLRRLMVHNGLRGEK